MVKEKEKKKRGALVFILKMSLFFSIQSGKMLLDQKIFKSQFIIQKKKKVNAL
jgi:hypothetical protein